MVEQSDDSLPLIGERKKKKRRKVIGKQRREKEDGGLTRKSGYNGLTTENNGH
jgi:hypothetical protein